jgi:hypothetical protein
VFAKGPKYREHISINWKNNLKMRMDAKIVPDIGQDVKKEELDTLSE